MRTTSLRRVLDSDLFFSFKRSPLTVAAAIVTALFFFGAALAPLIVPQDPFNPAARS